MNPPGRQLALTLSRRLGRYSRTCGDRGRNPLLHCSENSLPPPLNPTLAGGRNVFLNVYSCLEQWGR